jgi:hypothetical protein
MKKNLVLFNILIWVFVFVLFVFFQTQIVIAQDWICTSTYSYKSCNPSCGPPACIPTAPCCGCMECLCVGCIETYGECCNCTDPSQACGGCFTGETEIKLGQESERAGEQEGEQTKQIKDLKSGDVVESFNPETGEIEEGTVSDITKTTREGYYILETESGEKVKVTAEHPFLAVKNQESINQVSNLREKIANILSQTLTYKVITALQAKLGEILR